MLVTSFIVIFDFWRFAVLAVLKCVTRQYWAAQLDTGRTLRACFALSRAL